MTQEIVRALVNGVWVTEVANQSGGSQSGSARWIGPYAIPYNAPVNEGVGYAIQDLFQPDEGTWFLGAVYDPVVPFDVSVGQLEVGSYDPNIDSGIGVLSAGLGSLTPATDRSGTAALVSNNAWANNVVQWVDGTTPARAHWVNGGDSEGLINVYFLVASGELP